MLDFTKLWDLQYLFGRNSVGMSRSDLIFFWTAVVLIVVAVVIKIVAVRKSYDDPGRSLLNRYFNPLITIGILVLLWAGARFQNIPWIETHFLVLLIWLALIVWLAFIVRHQRQSHKELVDKWQSEKVKSKYLP